MKRAAAIVLLGAALLAGCSTGDQRSVVRAHGVSAFPGETVQDWATYGDYVVEWSVASERRLPPTAEEVQHNEGTITRLVTAQTTKVVWKRAGAPSTLTAPQTLELANEGWVFHGTDEKPFVMDDSPRLDVGKRYLAVLSYTDLSLGGSSTPSGAEWIAVDWVPLNSSGVVTVPAATSDEPADSTSTELAGKSSTAVQNVLNGAAVPAAAKSNMSIDPVLRYQKVADSEAAAQRQAAPSYTPGPGPGEKE